MSNRGLVGSIDWSQGLELIAAYVKTLTGRKTVPGDALSVDKRALCTSQIDQ